MPKIKQFISEDSMTVEQKYYTPKSLAGLLGISESLLNKLRINGKGPAYNKISHKIVRYPSEEVARYLKNHKRQSTSQKEVL